MECNGWEFSLKIKMVQDEDESDLTVVGRMKISKSDNNIEENREQIYHFEFRDQGYKIDIIAGE